MTQSPYLVTPQWIAERRADPLLFTVDATLNPPGDTVSPSPYSLYLEEHIPGAVFFDIEALSDPSSPYPHMLPTPADFATAVGKLGIPTGAKIVVYERANLFSSPRVWWTFKTFGVAEVYVLDGGLAAWKSLNYPLQSGPNPRPPASFVPTYNPNAVSNIQQVRQASATHSAQILDARSAARFNATAPEPRAHLRSGHMPNATSLPYTEVLANGRLKPVEDLQTLFAANQINLAGPIITTCGSGVTAAVLSLALASVQAPHTTLYDGSWTEWATAHAAGKDAPILP